MSQHAVSRQKTGGALLLPFDAAPPLFNSFECIRHETRTHHPIIHATSETYLRA